MKIKDQIISFEYAKRLKELGVKQNGYFCWFRLLEKSTYDLSEQWQIDDLDRFEEISAFTVAELVNILPECVPQEGDLMMWNYMEGDQRTYGVDYAASGWPVHYGIKFADALAKQLIWLIENNKFNLNKEEIK